MKKGGSNGRIYATEVPHEHGVIRGKSIMSGTGRVGQDGAIYPVITIGESSTREEIIS